MTSKQIYALVGAVALIATVVWWGSSRNTAKDVPEDNNQEETNTPPTTSVNPTFVPEKPVPTVPTAKSLAGSTFRLVTYNGTPVPSNSKFTLTFTEGSLTLKLCNTLSSNYYIDNNLIKADNIERTAMSCNTPSNIMKIESDISFMLDSGLATIYRSGSTLILSHKSGIVMAFEGF
ncbi:MAG: hypothetical protein A3J09_00680 [Candidatus Zambryskibacteria bacterium RIFCSPLOWO2_02_FULL_51_21]|uniref:DUF306 domain-containing protein n=1 Tax=Candidatus Zambryskibacteria bacterium RIFCSPHIGHO2_02_FULL_43_37 TaxID=1802749 RepID=A0A1G2THE2_9BACT|nr:MAG: hypothetical protein A2723_00675 [Candidatus Zambryskibacteria bacterium RIFCSPHIGHO2_01_FULL_52_18]OHA96716.1 MAG: hypothetical protein A3D49_02640 [Candidatus Zambryskibacteria bacterium RIFCSPHIGHO2_02_FULL_43_37]OHB07409.1 MAG: hypothetical protein A2944_01715 [Candidatus Zambryskibacteria bacterium RIFCSPLOWO2_01_FULL_52_12]OHB11071.1 MAG: hypothetical protein A3J09_00680 [Candidatus Zambryskibacteria bacterium RIFCSPLOWO2_02_FULL_51_21]